MYVYCLQEELLFNTSILFPFFLIHVVIAEHIDAENVLALMESAYNYDNALVRQKCIEFFIDNAKEIMARKEEWKRFTMTHPGIISELLYWIVNRDEFHRQDFQQ